MKNPDVILYKRKEDVQKQETTFVVWSRYSYIIDNFVSKASSVGVPNEIKSNHYMGLGYWAITTVPTKIFDSLASKIKNLFSISYLFKELTPEEAKWHILLF